MKTLGQRDNFRVVIEPRGLGNFGSIHVGDSLLYGTGREAQERIAAEYEDRCREILQQTKRHIDEFGHGVVEFDQSHVCSHCGRHWTEESAEYNGGCCQKDQEPEDERERLAELAKEIRA